jgi:Secretion system C-terminal sorting domain
MKLSSLIFSITLICNVYSQQAADYFPQGFGYKWNYRLSILDSLNNQVPDLQFYQVDSSAFLSEYYGKEAYHILSKSATQETIQFIPYSSTNYVHLTGSNGYEYNNSFELEFLFNLIDSTSLPFIGIFESFNGWYLYYRFSEIINQQYQISSFDTTVTFDSLEVPLRFNLTGKRLPDENLATGIGTFLCKKFLITNSISYLVNFPPFPPIPVPLISTRDSIWMAPGNWIVKNIIPSTNIDLTLINGGNYSIPGLKREIISDITRIKEMNINEPIAFNLEQNYPNPFNPSTNIKFHINKTGIVLIKIFDALGRIVDIVLNEELSRGDYEIAFDGSSLSTGTYFYVLEFSDINSKHNFRKVKKMVLIK